MSRPRHLLLVLLAPALQTAFAAAPAEAIAALSPIVLDKAQRESAASMIDRDLQRRQDAANARNRAAWSGIAGRDAWEAYRDTRLARLKDSLGTWPAPPAKLEVRVTGTVAGDGFVIENLVFQSRPGDWVPGNLYRPAEPGDSMPGILIAHAHHQGKNQGELQDMGMTWARAGCVVLVIDQVGYGERRAHPFHGPDDFAQDYPVGRQDYYYRYDSGIQLHLAGESLMGWMVWDLMRGVDLLLDRDGIDPARLIILGAVAGGGDPCGITAALDRRIAAAVPFNFGGPQPETRYPLPDDAETSFNYLMGSYWESTRGLRRTAADDFFHWVITASIAPRRLVHAHEFAWDGARDPVWKRYRRIYDDFYGAPGHLAVAHGKGLLRGSAPEASHCGQIGRFHRRMIHPVFERWFGIEVGDADEFSARRPSAELLCLPDAVRRELMPANLVDLVAEAGRTRSAAARERLAPLDPAEQRRQLRARWTGILGEIEPASPARLLSSRLDDPGPPGMQVERVVLGLEPDVTVPLLLLSAPGTSAPNAVVVALAHQGKQGFLAHRADLLAELVQGGALVCLPDLRGTGESQGGTARGRTSGDTNRSVNTLLHDQTLLGQRLRDLRAVLAWLQKREPEGASRLVLWGDSFAPVNAPHTDFQVPHGVDGRPPQSEPLGGLLAFLGTLFHDDVARVYVHRGLASWQSVLASPHVYLPHDAVVPGALTAGDLSDLAAALAPRPLRFHALVDGLNRSLAPDALRAEYRPALEAYRHAGADSHLVLDDPSSPARWLLSK